MKPTLSILTPACWNRIDQSKALSDKIAAQCASFPAGTVEHLVLLDQRTRSIGLKRQALVDVARGRYIAFVDDDDDISEDYVAKIIEAARANQDVITFCQQAIYNDKPFTVEMRLGQKDENWKIDGPDNQHVLRNAWHVCAWKREKVRHCQFLDCSYGEDRIWCMQARQACSTSEHIDAILHTYRHHAQTTLAPANVPVSDGAKKDL